MHLYACLPNRRQHLSSDTIFSLLQVQLSPWRPAWFPGTTCPHISWLWWETEVWGKALSPYNSSRRSSSLTTTPPLRTRTSNTQRSMDNGPFWMVSSPVRRQQRAVQLKQIRDYFMHSNKSGSSNKIIYYSFI